MLFVPKLCTIRMVSYYILDPTPNLKIEHLSVQSYYKSYLTLKVCHPLTAFYIEGFATISLCNFIAEDIVSSKCIASDMRAHIKLIQTFCT